MPMSAEFDRAVDVSVRELLDREPRDDVRARVVARLEHRPRRAAWVWIALPAAAALVLMVVLFSRSPAVRPSIAISQVDVPPPQVTAPAVVEQPTPQARSAPRPRPSATTHTAISGNAPDVTADEHAVEALPGPAPLALPTIGRGAATPVGTIEVAPIALEPLAVDPLSDTPRDVPRGR